jgi:hypothetical protein
VASLVVDLSDPDTGSRVHRQSRVLLRRPATGVSGHESLSSSEDEESRFSPVLGCLGWGELSSDESEVAILSARDADVFSELLEASECCVAEMLESDDALEVSEDNVETDASRSE